ncbi:MAG: DUF3885 domain-containing protein [Bacteroidetes bacterium]|nr:DUF3885 domain-containing protein [Bacteroidota bacterium]
MEGVESKKDLANYLKQHFNGLALREPLFFSWTNALRFDLQNGEPSSEDYFKEVDKRSSALFEAIFRQTEDVFVIYIEYKWKRRKIRFSNYCFKQINALKRTDIDYFVVRHLYEKQKDDIYNIAITKVKAIDINHKNVLKAIANTDFPPREPRFKFLNNPNIYFINISRNVIFHMYDDRGLDIIASDINILKPIYQKYNSWILNTNREHIDKIMA